MGILQIFTLLGALGMFLYGLTLAQAIGVMIFNLEEAFAGRLGEMTNAYEAEDRINTMRNNLRDEEIDDVENSRRNRQTSVYYMDIVSELEKMGDFMINVSQALYNIR